VTIPVNVRAAAQRDIDDAARWYESQQPGLGDAFLDEFLAASFRIGEDPLAYPEVGRSTRRILLRRFPFGIYYRLANDAAVVLAVMHGSRDPQRWKERT
jgi:plasmid stabilization system protein ParE